jgi:hypothetical protein
LTSRRADFDHLVRMAALFAAGVTLFVAARAVLIPHDFGVYGHYRASALADNRADPLVHAGRGACLACHAEPAQALGAGVHHAIGCEACHGPLARHAAAPKESRAGKPDGRTLCLRCHARNETRPATFPQVDAAEHAPEGTCVDCHAAHSPKL